MKTIRDKLIVALMVILVAGIFGCSSGKKGEYRGFVPVSRAEAEAFAEQLVAKFKQGDKQPFFDFGTDVDAVMAYYDFSGVDVAREMNLSEQQIQSQMNMQKNANKTLFGSLKQVELNGVKEDRLGMLCVVLDIVLNPSKNPASDRKLTITLPLLKKKSTDEIVVATYNM